MSRHLLAALLLFGLVCALLPGVAWAQPGETPVATADLERRIADLEAYVNNGARDMETSKLAGPGPGHNAWLMTCAALVLFMTLPGLALFYGGLVRQKNVLSVIRNDGMPVFTTR